MKITEACISAAAAIPSNRNFKTYTKVEQQYIADDICRSTPELNRGSSDAFYCFMGHVDGLNTTISDLLEAVWKEAFNTLSSISDTSVIVFPLLEGVSTNIPKLTLRAVAKSVRLVLVTTQKDDVSSIERFTQKNYEHDVIGLRLNRRNGGTGTAQYPGRLFFLAVLSIPRLDSVGLAVGEPYRQVSSLF